MRRPMAAFQHAGVLAVVQISPTQPRRVPLPAGDWELLHLLLGSGRRWATHRMIPAHGIRIYARRASRRGGLIVVYAAGRARTEARVL